MPSFHDFSYPSCDGEHSIHARRCVPDTEPKAIIQIAHGVGDYIERYDELMAYLAERGYLVAGNDHLGHGRNIRSEFDRGFFAAEDGWDLVVGDMHRLHRQMQEEYPGLPYIFYGHSMGSFLTRSYMIRYPGSYDAVILSGTGHMPSLTIRAGYALCCAAVKQYGPRKTADFLNKVAFGSYNKRIKFPRTEFDWISCDPDVVARYVADPLCGFVCKTSLYRDMMGALLFITRQKNIGKISKTAPVYFLSGAQDPVGEYGAGVERAYQAFCKAGVRDVFFRLYPEGRHEMHNELNRQQVYADVYEWLELRLPTLKK